ncbi:MAG: lytic murein transglycosylase B [Gammaproteobacteria bacterium]
MPVIRLNASTRSWLTSALLPIALAITLAPTGASADYSAHPQARDFLDRVTANKKLDPAFVSSVLAQAERRDDILALMSKPAEGKPWHAYRKIFLVERRIAAGVAFWKENARLLEEASARFGVDPRVIVAIIGVETMYGGNIGRHRVIDALATLGFDYPRRGEFFRKELEQFLLLLDEEPQLDWRKAVGSYAGAMGWGQFIPSSYRAYAVDGDGDGTRDLWNSKADIISSVANYFSRHGWKAGEAVALPVSIPPELEAKAVRKAVKPKRSLDQWRDQGVAGTGALPGGERAELVAYEKDETRDEYWLTLHNFYVITRYNRSHKYAMAVYQLGEEIARRYQAELGGDSAHGPHTNPGAKG